MPRNYKKRQDGVRQYANYTEESLAEAVAAVTNGSLSQRKAQERYNIPRSTLQNKLGAKHKKNIGTPTVFTHHEEEIFTTRCIILCNWGFPVNLLDLRMIVAGYLTKQSRVIKKFKNNIPGDDWARNFMARWELSHRLVTNIRRKRAKITKQQLEEYFTNIEKELQDVPASNIWNYDETNLRDDPGKKKFVVKRGCKYPELVMNNTKMSYSIMFCGNASGQVLAPYAVFKSKHLYYEWTMNGPKGARYNRTKSGWFDEATFEDWFFSMMLLQLKKQDGKKVIIGDNLSSHLSESVVQACKENNISFLSLLPNATHMLQPLDVAFFAPLKKLWRNLLREWRITPCGRKTGTLGKEDFSTLLTKLVSQLLVNAAENLKGGFRKCGLVPFNPEVYDTLPIANVMSPRKAMDQSVLGILQELRGDDEEEPGPSNSKKRTKLDVQPGKSVVVPEEESDDSDENDDDEDTGFSSSDNENAVPSDADNDDNKSDDSSDLEKLNMTHVTIDQWVKVKYEGEFFLGNVLSKLNDQALVHCLEKPFGIGVPQDLERENDSYLL